MISKPLQGPVRFFLTALAPFLLVTGCDRGADGDPGSVESPATRVTADPPSAVEVEAASGEAAPSVDGGGRAAGTDPARAALVRFVTGLQEADKDAVLSCIDQTSPNGRTMARLLSPVLDVASANREFVAALTEKFGEERTEQIRSLLGGFDLTRNLGQLQVDTEKAEIEIEGDVATVSVRGQPTSRPLTLVQKEGRWYVKPPADMAMSTEQLEMVERAVVAFGKLFERGRAALEEADSPASFEETFQGLLREAVTQVMPGASLPRPEPSTPGEAPGPEE